MKTVDVEIKVDSKNVEKALLRVKKAMEDVQRSAIIISVQQTSDKKWWEFWK